MPRKGGLGKGLDALIPAMDESTGATDVPVDAIVPNPHQPRTVIDQASLEELAASIREHGLIQPLIVTAMQPMGRGEIASPLQYQLIAGERRWRAARLAGLTSVPVVIKEVAPQQMLELALVENLQRADLNPLEAATAYKQLMDEFGLTQDQVARRVGKTRVVVANALRLLRLPAPIKSSLVEGKISEGHARALLGLDKEELQLRALAVVTRNALSVRQTEELVRRWLAEPKVKIKQVASAAEMRAIEKRFQQSLGTRVDLFHSKKGGRIVIHYYSDEELDAIYQKIIGQE
jgi:ParB family transcriptional regulator, chromosome partitioning protein